MALPNKLQLARMTNATLGSSIDDKVGELEQALSDVLGIPIDTAISDAILGVVDSSGRLTTPLRFYVGTSDVAGGTYTGIRIRDNSSSDECLLTVQDNWLSVYHNTGTEAAPSWTLRNKLDLDTGIWSGGSQTFAALTDTPIDIGASVQGQAVLADFGGGSLVFGPAESLRVKKTASQNIASTTLGVAVIWDNPAVHDSNGGLFNGATYPTRFIPFYTGYYRVSAQVTWATDSSNHRYIGVSKNGSGTVEFYGPRVYGTASGVIETSVTGTVYLLDTDYVEIHALHTSTTDPLAITAGHASFELLR